MQEIMAAWFPRLTMWFQVGCQGNNLAAVDGAKRNTPSAAAVAGH
jgi:hypothetical protein